MSKNILLKIFLVFLGLAVAFAAGEILLRSKREALSGLVWRYDSQTGLNILKANTQFDNKSSCFDVQVKGNSQGFFDTEFSLDKPKDVFRIAILGDSFIESFQVNLQKSMQYLLEQKLNEMPNMPKKFEVYSFGHGGNGTFKNYLYLNQYALKYKPDLVILAFLPINDFGNDYGVRSEIFDNNGKVRTQFSEGEKIANKSVLINWLIFKWQILKVQQLDKYLRKISSNEDATAKVPFDFQVFLKDYPASWQKVWDLEKTLLTDFNKTVQASGSKFLLVSVNDMWRTHPELMQKDQEISQAIKQFDFNFDKPEEILTEFAKAQNIPYLNLMPIMKDRVEKEQKRAFWSCDGHWNETGQQWATDAIFQFLTQGRTELIKN